MLNHHWITLSNVFLYLTFIRKCPSPTAPGSFTRPSDGTTRHSSTRLSHTLWHFDLCVLRMAHELRSSQIHVNKAFVGENRAALWGRWFWMGFAILSICTLYIYTHYIVLYWSILYYKSWINRSSTKPGFVSSFEEYLPPGSIDLTGNCSTTLLGIWCWGRPRWFNGESGGKVSNVVSPKINLCWGWLSSLDLPHWSMPRTKSALRWCAQQLCCPFVVNRLLPARRCEILISNPGLITSFKRWVTSDISQIHSHRTASHLGTRFMNLISGHCKLQQHVMGHDMSRYVMVRHSAPVL